MDASAANGMAQRVGLNKVRHIEVDVLWLQEQMARRLLRTVKIPGPRNSSDLCNKNVSFTLLEQYFGQLNIYFADVHAAVAQQLHSLVFAHPGDADPLAGLPGKASCQEIAPCRTAPEVGAVLAGAGPLRSPVEGESSRG